MLVSLSRRRSRVQIPSAPPSFAKASEWLAMFYCYILQSHRLHRFYYGHTADLDKRITLHNTRQVTATKSGAPWDLVWYGAFGSITEAQDFEKYLKSGSGKAFAYKRLISEALAKDLRERNPSIASA